MSSWSISTSLWRVAAPETIVTCDGATPSQRATARITAAFAHSPTGGSRTHSCSVEPSHSSRSVRVLAWTRTASRIRPLTGRRPRASAHGAERHRPPLLGDRRDVVLPLCPRRTGQDLCGAGLEGEFGRLPGACPAAAEPQSARGLQRDAADLAELRRIAVPADAAPAG